MYALTYFQPVPELPREEGMRQAWHRVWSRNGWQTGTIGLQDAMAHPRYESFAMKLRTWPSICPRGYAEGVFLRWLALDHWLSRNGASGALLADYDMFNVNLQPHHLQSCAGFESSGWFTVDGADTCSAANWVTAPAAGLLPAIFETLAMRLTVPCDGGRHVDDMTVWQHLRREAKLVAHRPWCRGYTPELPAETPRFVQRDEPMLIHFSNTRMQSLKLDRTMKFIELEQLLWPSQ